MLNWAITFFLLAVIASVFRFGGLAGTFGGIAKNLTVLFVILLVASLVYSAVRSRRLPAPQHPEG